MYLTVRDGFRAWKSFDWEATGRLYQQGLIEDPVSKTKFVVLREQGLFEAERLFNKLFALR